MSRTLALNFVRLSDGSLSLTAMFVVNKMANNKYFPQTAAQVNEISKLLDAFKAAVANASTGDRAKAATKNELRAQLIAAMQQLGRYVILEAQGSELLLLRSGFPLTKKSRRTGLGAVDDFKVLPGQESGEIILQVKRITGAKSYVYQYTPVPVTSQSNWQTVYGTTCKTVLRGLTPGVQYGFRMGGVGARQQVVYTEVIVRYVWH